MEKTKQQKALWIVVSICSLFSLVIIDFHQLHQQSFSQFYQPSSYSIQAAQRGYSSHDEIIRNEWKDYDIDDQFNLKVWNSDFHISPAADNKWILKHFNISFIDKSLSGHCHLMNTCQTDLRIINNQNGIDLSPCPNKLRREFYESYRSDNEMDSIDIVLCTHAASMCELFMPFDKSMIIIASTRYEIGRHDAKRWKEWNKNLERIASKPTNIIAANNLFDVEYIKYFTSISRVEYLPSLAGYVTDRYSYLTSAISSGSDSESSSDSSSGSNSGSSDNIGRSSSDNYSGSRSSSGSSSRSGSSDSSISNNNDRSSSSDSNGQHFNGDGDYDSGKVSGGSSNDFKMKQQPLSYRGKRQIPSSSSLYTSSSSLSSSQLQQPQLHHHHHRREILIAPARGVNTHIAAELVEVERAFHSTVNHASVNLKVNSRSHGNLRNDFDSGNNNSHSRSSGSGSGSSSSSSGRSSSRRSSSNGGSSNEGKPDNNNNNQYSSSSSSSSSSSLTKYHDFHFKHIRELYPQHFEYSDLVQHPAIILLPYQISFMSFFEFYRMCIPMFVPSVELLTKWHIQYQILNEKSWNSVFGHPFESHSVLPRHPLSTSQMSQQHDPNNDIHAESLLKWLPLADFYTYPYITTFQSWDELMVVLGTADLLNISKSMYDYNIQLEGKVMNQWKKILDVIHKRKMNQTVSNVTDNDDDDDGDGDNDASAEIDVKWVELNHLRKDKDWNRNNKKKKLQSSSSSVVMTVNEALQKAYGVQLSDTCTGDI